MLRDVRKSAECAHSCTAVSLLEVAQGSAHVQVVDDGQDRFPVYPAQSSAVAEVDVKIRTVMAVNMLERRGYEIYRTKSLIKE